MKVLIVASCNSGRFVPFLVEQARALQCAGCEVDFFGLKGKGVKGYLENLPALNTKIKEYCPEVIHAHYGLSGLLANMQRKVPVVTTYHGSDINDQKVLFFSRFAIRFSAWNVFVSRKTMEIANPRRHFSLVPCGIDLDDLQLTVKDEARRRMGLSPDKRYVLFAGAFDNEVKNAPLAVESVGKTRFDVELLELKGYSREEVTLLMCAADVFFMTSLSEGSPQVIKEAMACGCPIVSVDVGDVGERVDGVKGCYVSRSRDPMSLAKLIDLAIEFEGKTTGRNRIVEDGLDNHSVAKRIMDIYHNVLNGKNGNNRRQQN